MSAEISQLRLVLPFVHLLFTLKQFNLCLLGWICLLYSRAGLAFKLLYCNYVSGAFETQNCRNSIIAPGRQEVAYGSVEIDCPGVFSVAFCHFRIFCVLMRYCWLLSVPSLLIPSVHLLSPVNCTACTLGPALRASWLVSYVKGRRA